MTELLEGERLVVAEAFVDHDGLTPAFWRDSRVAALGDSTQKQVASMRDLLGITQNVALATYVKSQQQRVSDCAKYDLAGWVGLIAASGVSIADHESAAASMLAESQRCFPTIALAAEASRGDSHGLAKLSGVMALLDMYPELDLEHANLAEFGSRQDVKSNLGTLFETDEIAGIMVDLNTLQRVQRLSPDANVGKVLLEKGFTSSFAVVSAGPTQLAKALVTVGLSKVTVVEVHDRA